MGRKQIMTFAAAAMTVAVMFTGCGAPAGKAASVEGENIVGCVQTAEGTDNSGAAAQGGSKAAGQEGSGAGAQEESRAAGQNGSGAGAQGESKETGQNGSRAAGQEGSRPTGQDSPESAVRKADGSSAEGQENGSQAGSVPVTGSHPDLLSRTTHQSLFEGMAVQGNVVELQEGCCVIDPPQEQSHNGTQIMVSGVDTGNRENYVTASFNSDCRVYKCTYNDADGSISLKECGTSDIAVGNKLLLYGSLSGKSIAVSDVVIR